MNEQPACGGICKRIVNGDVMVSHRCIVRCTRYGLCLLVLLLVVLVFQFIVDGDEDDMLLDGYWERVDPDSLQGNERFTTKGWEIAENETIPYPIILWWTGFTGEPGRPRMCGQDTCFFTADSSYQNHRNTTVFVFYGTDYEISKLPVPRLQHHEWAVFHEESPKNNYLFSHAETLELFNHTATFRQQSDFPLTTQYLADLSDVTTSEYMVDTAEKSRLRQEEGLAMVAYVQSDCDTESDRDHFVEMLQRHIAVDAYGKCLHNKDLPDHLTDPIKGMDHKDFYQHLARYKFVLAMENAICEDYITEKFWRTFTVGSVPIVFGSPTAKKYTPDDHSAIFIEDFATVEDLVAHLIQLDSNDDAYDAYLRYKRDGVRNVYLQHQMNHREWGVNDDKKPNFIDGFECLICRRVQENWRRRSAGLTAIAHRADVTHYGCPRPLKFSDNPPGHLSRHEVLDWGKEYDYTRYYARAVKQLVESGANFSSNAVYDLAQDIRSRDSRR